MKKQTKRILINISLISIFLLLILWCTRQVATGQTKSPTIPETKVENSMNLLNELGLSFTITGVQQIQHEQISNWYFFKQNNYGYINNDTVILCIGETDYIIACDYSTYSDFQELNYQHGLLVGYNILGYDVITNEKITVELWQYAKEPENIYLALIFGDRHLTISYVLTNYQKIE